MPRNVAVGAIGTPTAPPCLQDPPLHGATVPFPQWGRRGRKPHSARHQYPKQHNQGKKKSPTFSIFFLDKPWETKNGTGTEGPHALLLLQPPPAPAPGKAASTAIVRAWGRGRCQPQPPLSEGIKPQKKAIGGGGTWGGCRCLMSGCAALPVWHRCPSPRMPLAKRCTNIFSGLAWFSRLP